MTRPEGAEPRWITAIEWRHWWDWSHASIEAAQHREHEQFMVGRLMERLGNKNGPFEDAPNG